MKCSIILVHSLNLKEVWIFTEFSKKLKVSDKIICQEIYFSNDVRENKFKCQFSIAANCYKNAKVPDMSKYQKMEQNVFKKPPIPQQTQVDNFFIQHDQGK